jgi:drug/metabolite transporter (DMT)-like permease
MAQTRKRRRKHRGTQGGSIDRRGRRARPRSRQEARARARKQMGTKRDLPPTWGSALTRGLFGAGLFAVLLIALFGRPVASSLVLAALMLLIYVPLGHLIDIFFYRRRQAAKQRQRERSLRGE